MLSLLSMAEGIAFLGTAFYIPVEAFIALLIGNLVTQTTTGCLYFLRLYLPYQKQ